MHHNIGSLGSIIRFFNECMWISLVMKQKGGSLNECNIIGGLPLVNNWLPSIVSKVKAQCDNGKYTSRRIPGVLTLKTINGIGTGDP